MTDTQPISQSPETYGSALKSWRLNRHLTQHELAQLIGTHRPRVSDWETGRHRIRGIVLFALRRLGYDPS